MPVDPDRSRLLIPATVFLTVGGLFTALWAVVNGQAANELRLRSSLSAEQAADHIERNFEVCFRVIRQFCDDWEAGLVPTRSAFERRASSIIHYFPSISAIQTLDETGGIKWRAPGGQQLVWLTPGGERRVNPTEFAEDELIRVTPAIRFSRADVGIVAYFPLRNTEAKSLRVSLLASTFFKDAVLPGGVDHIAYIIYDEGDPIYQWFADTGIPASEYANSRLIQVGDRQWRVGVALLPGPTDLLRSLGRNLVLVSGLLVAGGLAFVSSRLLSSQRRLRENEERLRAVAEHIPGVVYSYETAPGRPRSLIYLGPGLDAMIGPRMTARVEENFDALFELVHPDDLVEVLTSAARGSTTGETIDCEARLMTDEGSYRWVRSLSRALKVDRERIRWHVVLIDISEHRRTVDALRESEERYRLLVESSPVGVMIHSNMICQFVNPAVVRLLGYDSADDLTGKNIELVIPPEDRQMVRDRVAQFDAECEPLRFGGERLRRRDGTNVDVEIIVSTINFGGGTARQVLVLDTTEQRQTEQRQRLLMQELDHRVKNNLASVLALLDQTAASAHHIDEFRAKFANRIKAMARTHEMLARTKWSGVGMSDVIRVSLAPHIVEESDRIRLDGPSLLIRPRPAMPIGLALHELATNALKYGSLSTPNGRVDIRWRRENTSILIEWTESGGPLARSPDEFGMGLRLVRGLVEFELGGRAQFDFESGSLVCTLCIDAETLTEEPA